MRAMWTPTKSDSLRIGTVHFFVELLEKLGTLFRAEFAFQLFQCECDDVIVVRASELGVRRNVEPQFVHEFHVLRTHARSVWAEGVLADRPIGCADFQAQPRTRLLQPLPRIAGQLGLLVRGKLVRQAADYAARIEPLRGHHYRL